MTGMMGRCWVETMNRYMAYSCIPLMLLTDGWWLFAFMAWAVGMLVAFRFVHRDCDNPYCTGEAREP